MQQQGERFGTDKRVEAWNLGLCIKYTARRGKQDLNLKLFSRLTLPGPLDEGCWTKNSVPEHDKHGNDDDGGCEIGLRMDMKLVKQEVVGNQRRRLVGRFIRLFRRRLGLSRDPPRRLWNPSPPCLPFPRSHVIFLTLHIWYLIVGY